MTCEGALGALATALKGPHADSDVRGYLGVLVLLDPGSPDDRRARPTDGAAIDGPGEQIVRSPKAGTEGLDGLRLGGRRCQHAMLGEALERRSGALQEDADVPLADVEEDVGGNRRRP